MQAIGLNFRFTQNLVFGVRYLISKKMVHPLRYMCSIVHASAGKPGCDQTRKSDPIFSSAIFFLLVTAFVFAFFLLSTGMRGSIYGHTTTAMHKLSPPSLSFSLPRHNFRSRATEKRRLFFPSPPTTVHAFDFIIARRLQPPFSPRRWNCAYPVMPLPRLKYTWNDILKNAQQRGGTEVRVLPKSPAWVRRHPDIRQPRIALRD